METGEFSHAEETLTPVKEVLMVFGQGPVQEYEKAEGEKIYPSLNFFSRLNALAASQLLIDGKTDEIIVSGGATGAKKIATEGDLMAEAIKKRLRWDIQRQLHTASEQSTAVITIGTRSKEIVLHDKTTESLDADINLFLDSFIRVENQAQDSLENFVNILNILDTDTSQNSHLSFLGIGFHATNKHSGATMGRLEKLADIFQLEGDVISAEDILRDYANTDRNDNSFVKKQLELLTEMSADHDVALQKSRQESLLIEELDQGVWITKIAKMTNPDRIKKIVLHNNLLRQKLAEYYQIVDTALEDKLDTTGLTTLQTDILTVGQKVLASESYKSVNAQYVKTKSDVFNKLEAMRNEMIKKIIGQPDMQKSLQKFMDAKDLEDISIEELLRQVRNEYQRFTLEITQCNKKIENLQHQRSSDATELQKLQEERLALVTEREALHTILVEDRYNNPASYLMQYGKGEDMRQRKKN